MVAPSGTLPTSNEEYGTKEYWCALNMLVLFNFLKLFQGAEIRTVSHPRKFKRFVLCLRPGRTREAQVTFDWFKSYEDIAHLLRPVLPDQTARILILGCGNSTLSEDVCVLVINSVSISSKHSALLEHAPTTIAQMYDDGYKNIVNVDVRSRYDQC